MTLRLCVVLPVHNEESILATNLDRLCVYLESLSGEFEVVLVENASRDHSRALCQQLAGRRGRIRIRFASTDAAGLGYAYHLGIQEGRPADDGWFLLTSAELPFGTSDFAEFLKWREQHPDGALALGSKAHEQSHAPSPPARRLASFGFYWLRRGIINLRVGDSQGSVFVRADLARRLAPEIRARDYFYSTELIFLAKREGHSATELPVMLEPGRRPSTVRLHRDAPRMFSHLVRVRREHGRIE